MKSAPIDVLCIGQAPYDLSFTVPHYPGPNEKCVATAFRGSGGGPAANAAVTVARLGGQAALIAYLGRDVFGDMHLQELEAAGVETRPVQRGRAPTSLSVVLVQPDGRRALVNYRDETPNLPEGSVDLPAVRPRALLFDGLEPLLSPPLAQQARASQIPTVLDAGSVHPGTETLIELVDYAVVSAKFARQYTGHKNPAAALDALARVAPTVVITLGNEGLLWQSADGEGELPAFPVTAVDTNGAGDAFHGAFAYALARGRTWLDLLRYASAAAALTCTRHGARPAIPTAERVAIFLQNQQN